MVLETLTIEKIRRCSILSSNSVGLSQISQTWHEDYGMKINISKTKTMVIGRKLKKIDIQIEDESVEQVDSFKYLGCTISSNLNSAAKK